MKYICTTMIIMISLLSTKMYSMETLSNDEISFRKKAQSILQSFSYNNRLDLHSILGHSLNYNLKPKQKFLIVAELLTGMVNDDMNTAISNYKQKTNMLLFITGCLACACTYQWYSTHKKKEELQQKVENEISSDTPTTHPTENFNDPALDQSQESSSIKPEMP